MAGLFSLNPTDPIAASYNWKAVETTIKTSSGGATDVSTFTTAPTLSQGALIANAPIGWIRAVGNMTFAFLRFTATAAGTSGTYMTMTRGDLPLPLMSGTTDFMTGRFVTPHQGTLIYTPGSNTFTLYGADPLVPYGNVSIGTSIDIQLCYLNQ